MNKYLIDTNIHFIRVFTVFSFKLNNLKCLKLEIFFSFDDSLTAKLTDLRE